MDFRTQRVEAIVTYLVNNPDGAEKLTGPVVEQMYADRGIEVSARQARRGHHHSKISGRLTS